jgi:hypothetical protein
MKCLSFRLGHRLSFSALLGHTQGIRVECFRQPPIRTGEWESFP